MARIIKAVFGALPSVGISDLAIERDDSLIDDPLIKDQLQLLAITHQFLTITRQI
jgi:hypothetical protein